MVLNFDFVDVKDFKKKSFEILNFYLTSPLSHECLSISTCFPKGPSFILKYMYKTDVL